MGILDKTNAVVKIIKDLGNAELLSEIIDLKHEIVDLEEKNLKLRQENNELKKVMALKENLEFSDNAYWIKHEEGYDGPFCAGCADDKGKLIRLVAERGRIPGCPICKIYIAEESRPPDGSDAVNIKVFPSKMSGRINW